MFDWDGFKKGKIAVHCISKEHAEKFCKMMHEQGLKWCDGSSYLDDTGWDGYKEETCYRGDGEFLELNYAIREKYKIISFYEIERCIE